MAISGNELPTPRELFFERASAATIGFRAVFDSDRISQYFLYSIAEVAGKVAISALMLPIETAIRLQSSLPLKSASAPSQPRSSWSRYFAKETSLEFNNSVIALLIKKGCNAPTDCSFTLTGRAEL